MDKLEHKIQQIFAANDAKATFSRKEALWRQLDSSLGKSGKVAAWWRIAAVLLGLVTVGAVYAGFGHLAKQQAEMDRLKQQNNQLLHQVDSLISRPPVINTEYQTVEKVVYRDRVVHTPLTDSGMNWKEQYFRLQDSTQQLLASEKKNHNAELAKLEVQLNVVSSELNALQHPRQSAKDEPFQLKSERVELGIQKKPALNTQEINIRIFPRNIDEQTNDLNKTIFNK